MTIVPTFDASRIDALRQQPIGCIRLFAPYEDTHGAFLALLQSAKSSILISIYGYTLDDATDILIAKHQAGLDVRILFDHTQATGPAEKAQIAKLRAAGVPHWIGTSPVAGQILHAKVCIVDSILTESGSWNFSSSAAKQSNTFVIEQSSDVAQMMTTFVETSLAWVKANEPQYQDGTP